MKTSLGFKRSNFPKGRNGREDGKEEGGKKRGKSRKKISYAKRIEERRKGLKLKLSRQGGN